MKKSLSIFLSLIMIATTLFALPFTAKALTASGKIGNCNYKFDSSTGAMTISGSGDMTDYDSNNSPFYSESSIKSVVFNDGITSVAANLFAECDKLESVTLPRSLTKIGKSAFYWCTSLQRVIIPDGVTEIGEWAFATCVNLNTVCFPKSVDTIKAHAFTQDNKLDTIYYSSSAANWNNMVTMAGTDNDPLLNASTFHYNAGYCGENATFTISPSTGKAVIKGTGAMFSYAHAASPFTEHAEITSIEVGSGITTIGQSAFSYCENAETISIPDTVTAICDGAMFSTYKLTNLRMSNNVVSIGEQAFFSSMKLKKMAFPDSLKDIGDEAFFNCKALSTITFGKSIRKIGESAFENTAIKYVKLPKTITSINKYALGFEFNGTKDVKVSGFKLDIECDKKTTAAETYAKDSGLTYNMLHDFSDNAEYCRLKCGTKNPNYLPDITKFEAKAHYKQVSKYVPTIPNDEDPAGTKFSTIRAKMKSVTKGSITLTWAKVKNTKYYIVYGARCGENNKYKKLAKVTDETTYTHKKLKKNVYYKYIVVSFDKNNRMITASKPMHIATDGGKKGNFDKVVTSAKKDGVTLEKKDKTFKLNGSSKKNKNNKKNVQVHRTIRYESSNNKIATVSKKGVIKAKKKGTCYVYAYSQNGIYKKIKVTVKK